MTLKPVAKSKSIETNPTQTNNMRVTRWRLVKIIFQVAATNRVAQQRN